MIKQRILIATVAAAVITPAAAGTGRWPGAARAADEAQGLTSAEALKHSVLSRPAFWLIPEREGCVETTTMGPGRPPVAAQASWDTNVWVCTFTAELGVARCRNLNRVDVKTRKGAAFTDTAFVVRTDRSASWAAAFGGLTDAFVSEREQLITNARREYLLITDTFKRNPAATPLQPATTVHKVCSGRWEPMTAKDVADLEKRGAGGATPPAPSSMSPSSSPARPSTK